MRQATVNQIIGIILPMIFGLVAWILLEVKDHSEKLAAYEQSGINIEKGFTIILKKTDSLSQELNDVKIEVSRNYDKIDRNERDIESLRDR